MRFKRNIYHIFSPGSPGVGRGPGLWRNQRGAECEILLREGGRSRVHRGPELPELDEAGTPVHGVAAGPAQVAHHPMETMKFTPSALFIVKLFMAK